MAYPTPHKVELLKQLVEIRKSYPALDIDSEMAKLKANGKESQINDPLLVLTCARCAAHVSVSSMLYLNRVRLLLCLCLMFVATYPA